METTALNRVWAEKARSQKYREVKGAGTGTGTGSDFRRQKRHRLSTLNLIVCINSTAGSLPRLFVKYPY